MGSRQGNRGPPLPPPLIGCLCWLRHTRLAGPGRPAPRAGRWRRLRSCRSAAGLRPLASSPPPLKALGESWMEEVATSAGRQQGVSVRGGTGNGTVGEVTSRFESMRGCRTCVLLAGTFFTALAFTGTSLPLLARRNREKPK